MPTDSGRPSETTRATLARYGLRYDEAVRNTLRHLHREGYAEFRDSATFVDCLVDGLVHQLPSDRDADAVRAAKWEVVRRFVHTPGVHDLRETVVPTLVATFARAHGGGDRHASGPRRR